MKKLCLLVSCTFLTIHANVLLQKPKILSQNEIDTLAKNWETQFAWQYGQAQFTCCYEHEQASFIAMLFGIPLRSYNFQYLENIKKYFSKYKQLQQNYYYAKPLQIQNQTPKNLTFNELSNFINNQKVIFYTGAGISASGNVATMAGLQKTLKMDQGKKVFLHTLLFNPKILTDAFNQFCTSAIHNPPTAAHLALQAIAHKKNTSIVTENVDLLQQRTGSEPLFTHSDALQAVKDDELRDVEAIVCIGISYDDCGFLAYYKEKNPHGVLIAINLATPTYLSNDDYIIIANAQEILPKLAEAL